MASALVSHVVILGKNRSEYALGLSVIEVAQFVSTNISDIKSRWFYLKLRPDFPHLTVSGHAEKYVRWIPGEILFWFINFVNLSAFCILVVGFIRGRSISRKLLKINPSPTNLGKLILSHTGIRHNSKTNLLIEQLFISGYSTL